MMNIRNISMQVVRNTGRLQTTARVAPMSTSATRFRLKESSSHTDAEVEAHKRESIEKQKRGDGHWKAELASDSEENVKADREPGGPEHVKILQQQAKQAAEAERRNGGS